MKKCIYLLLFMVALLSSCSRGKNSYEINVSYNKKTEFYTIGYPEYNKIYPKEVEVNLRKAKSFEQNILFIYNIQSDNRVLTMSLVLSDGENKYTNIIEEPLVNVDVYTDFNASDFSPNIDVTKKINKAYIKIETIGDIDTKDIVSFSIKEYKDGEKPKEKTLELPVVDLPKPGHVASSNPPFILLDRNTDKLNIYLSQNKNFEIENATLERFNASVIKTEDLNSYSITGKSFLQTTNLLEEGKWYIKIEDSRKPESYSIYSFFIDESTRNINVLENINITNIRPFILADKTSLDVLEYFYGLKRNRDNNVLSRNILYFKEYAGDRLGRWSKNKIIYEGEVQGIDSFAFSSLESHAVIMSLYSYLNPTNSISRNETISMLKDISDINPSEVIGFSEVEASVILANSLLAPFDLLYNSFDASELIKIKEAIIKNGEVLYNYLIENPTSYKDVNTIKYASTLAIIGITMYNENLREGEVRNWYDFSLNYINSMIIPFIGTDGALKSSVGSSFEVVMPILMLATTLKNAGIINYFDMPEFRNLAKYLSVVAYPSGYTFPVGDTYINYKSDRRFDSGARTSVMELFSREYNNILYKKYATFGISENTEIKYLPFMLVWNAHRVNADIPFRNIEPFQYSYFKDIETVIYNENILNKNNAYFSLYGKGSKPNISHKLDHNDRLSFEYYNYGDKIIAEAGFSGQTNESAYSNIKSSFAHSTISVNDKEMLNHIGSYSYIYSSTNFNNILYVHGKFNLDYTYDLKLKNYDRRFYYLKPNIMIIKDDIEVLPDITKDTLQVNNNYTSRFTSKLPIIYNSVDNKFVIEGDNSITDIYILANEDIEMSVSEMNIDEGSPLYIAQIKTKEKVKYFSTWSIFITKPKSFRNNITTNIEVLEYDNSSLIFKNRNLVYNIYPNNINTNFSVLDYSSFRGNVNILSD